jgi:hypothetical protein
MQHLVIDDASELTTANIDGSIVNCLMVDVTIAVNNRPGLMIHIIITPKICKWITSIGLLLPSIDARELLLQFPYSPKLLMDKSYTDNMHSHRPPQA